jgi:hypothetical protein
VYPVGPLPISLFRLPWVFRMAERSVPETRSLDRKMFSANFPLDLRRSVSARVAGPKPYWDASTGLTAPAQGMSGDPSNQLQGLSGPKHVGSLDCSINLGQIFGFERRRKSERVKAYDWRAAQQRLRENRERWTTKKLELVSWRIFPPWTREELAAAQVGRGIKIRFYRRPSPSRARKANLATSCL